MYNLITQEINDEKIDLEKNKTLIHIKDDFNNNLLHLAVDENIPELVNYLLIKKVNPNVQNIDGDTCLHLAMKKGNTKIIGNLLEYGASIYIKNNKKEAPVDYATVLNFKIQYEIRKVFPLESTVKKKY